MNAIEEVVAGAGGALAGQLWKVATLVLAFLLLVVGAGAGTGWWLASTARDKALTDLKAEQGVNAELRAGITTQNTAILAQAKLAREAEARGDAARQAAAVSGRRFDQALQQLAGAQATGCADAMPYVNQLLEKVR
ncbi:hypothetical protein [Duganella callida]|uniref:Uncharacterized protein n=1 Tax=Duganella callida TaxID=2561932 RepID=A0A4Y9S662_9BURK|nr:hypothetical protein [Duganella callida]TFW15979.1 hypothetical protein E4L98_25125 [Duganella callida]